MPRHLHASGIVWLRLWPYRRAERLCAGWVTHIGQEAILLRKQEGAWLFDGYNLNWYYNEEGEYVHLPFDPVEQPILYTLQEGRFPTRRQALQALDGLLFARPEILDQDPKKRWPPG